jgi:predicted nucleic acid-binding protein
MARGRGGIGRIALAIESGSEWITTDRDFSRFSGLRRRHPLTD